MTDPNSLSNLDQIIASHVNLHLSFDFSEKVITGHADTTLTPLVEGLTTVVLDTKYQNIHAVFLLGESDPVELEFVVETLSELGNSLKITVPALSLETVVIRVEYSTTPEATAVQWLEPAQTIGKQHPYLFTQCQAIHARSLYPCQDAPFAKTTYQATLVVPSGLTAVMSAFSKGSLEREDGKTEYYFDQPICIPSYLMAIGIGKLVSREIGPRSKVWCEEEMVDEGAWEFAETEQFIKTGEDLLGDYIWGQYDILLLPPSFPYGGMENPMLTFVTPTLISGDRANADVVAHEIAHSWTGNLITNKTWEHFWLNEGFTVFVERKIIGRMHGELHRQLDAVIGWKSLVDSVKHFGEDHEFTKLIPNLSGLDPDDAFSSVPYEKGFNFLYYLETLVGGGEIFEPFLKDWIQSHKLQCVTSQEFQSFFTERFPEVNVDWDAWFYTPGMPLVTNTFDDTLVKTYEAVAKKWIEDDEQEFSSEDITPFSAAQLYGFLNVLLSNEKVFSSSALDKMDSLYNFSTSKNAEIIFRWCRLGLQSEYTNIITPTVNFLKSQGRMKFTRVLYRELHKSNIGTEVAKATFHENKHIYHPICSKMVESDLSH